MGATNGIDYNSELVRKNWLMEGLIGSKNKSVWDPLIGKSPDSVVYQCTDEGAGDGNIVVLDYSGKMSGEGRVGNERVFGTGEVHKKYSSKVEINEIWYSIKNGSKFEGKAVGDLSSTEHGYSRTKLSDYYQRVKDQWLFDAGQGFLARTQGVLPNDASIEYAGNTHVIRPNDRSTRSAFQSTDVMDYSFLLRLEAIARTGSGCTLGGTRRPLDPYIDNNGNPIWLLMVDAWQAMQLRNSSQIINLLGQADIRGDSNRLIKGQIGKIGSLLIVEAPIFLGTSSAKTIGKQGVEVSGLRTLDEVGTWSSTYTSAGTPISQTGKVASRGLLMGANALQFALGQQPDYKYQASEDFGRTSESAMQIFAGVQKTRLVTESTDFKQATVGGIDANIIAVETYVKG